MSEPADMPAPVRSEIAGAPAEPMSAAASSFIHLMRWLSAFLVLFHHVSTVLVSVPDIMTAPHGPLAYVWWFFTPYAFAHEAVVVFFVLSGFLVGGGVFERRRQTRPWLRGYAADRLVRIYVVLLPVLAITLLCDTVGRQFFPDATTYGLDTYRDRFDLRLMIPNVLSLQGLWFDPFGTNDPMWSLGMEVWFYLLFPLLLLPWLRAYPRHWLRVGGLAFAFLFLLVLPAGNYMRFGFCIWGLGVVARGLPAPLWRNRWAALLMFVVVSVVLRFTMRPPLVLAPPAKYLVDAANALLFANLLLTLRFDATGGFRLARYDIHRRLAAFSYTLYAVHVPVLFLIASAIGAVAGRRWRLEPATPLHYAIAIACTALLACLAWALSRVTEARTDDVRRAVKRRMERGRNAAAQRKGADA